MSEIHHLRVTEALLHYSNLGSHVVLVGLIDAGFLYDEMSERVHPLGKVGNTIRYKVAQPTLSNKY